jgi:NAD(P)H-flavin reductase/hemoglobin-like flavoprotein
MGLRHALSWFRSGDERRPRRVNESPSYRHQADPATGMRIDIERPRPRPTGVAPHELESAAPIGSIPQAATWGAPEAPPAPVGGGLVVGQADLRQPAVELPQFYTPSPQSGVAPTAPAPDTSPAAHIAASQALTTQMPAIQVPIIEAPTRPAAPPAAPTELAPAAAPQPYDRRAVRRAWELTSDRADQLVRNFYAELFFALPNEAMHMFPSSMVAQRDDFGRALVQWVVTDDPESMTAHLDQLGADHRKFEVEPRHYEIAGAALVSAWSNLLGKDWTPDVEAAVVGSYTRLATIMIDGAMRKQHEPAYWGATIIAHKRVMGDFAVLRVQPDAPYPYKAGQYLTVEVGSHSRQWRQMSIASAPRADNTFDIHVRAVAATGVSAALVMHTKPGDRIKLGPPRGNDLVIEPGTVSGGLLCVCSGTGAAPISAVVESLMGWPETPPLYAFVGGRTIDDMYPVDQLNQLVHSGGKGERVRVYGVVSDDPSYVGYRGKVEQVVPTLLDWARLDVDVLVAGPNTMIESTVGGLTDLGVPMTKIHFDQYESAG